MAFIYSNVNFGFSSWNFDTFHVFVGLFPVFWSLVIDFSGDVRIEMKAHIIKLIGRKDVSISSRISEAYGMLLNEVYKSLCGGPIS